MKQIKNKRKKYYEAEPGDVVEVGRRLGRVISTGEGKNVNVEILEDRDRCPYCKGELKTRWSALEHSPLFQESVVLISKRI